MIGFIKAHKTSVIVTAIIAIVAIVLVYAKVRNKNDFISNNSPCSQIYSN